MKKKMKMMKVFKFYFYYLNFDIYNNIILKNKTYIKYRDIKYFIKLK